MESRHFCGVWMASWFCRHAEKQASTAAGNAPRPSIVGKATTRCRFGGVRVALEPTGDQPLTFARHWPHPAPAAPLRIGRAPSPSSLTLAGCCLSVSLPAPLRLSPSPPLSTTIESVAIHQHLCASRRARRRQAFLEAIDCGRTTAPSVPSSAGPPVSIASLQIERTVAAPQRTQLHALLPTAHGDGSKAGCLPLRRSLLRPN